MMNLLGLLFICHDSFYWHGKNCHHTYLDIPATDLHINEISTALRLPNGKEQIDQESYSERYVITEISVGGGDWVRGLWGETRQLSGRLGGGF